MAEVDLGDGVSGPFGTNGPLTPSPRSILLECVNLLIDAIMLMKIIIKNRRFLDFT